MIVAQESVFGGYFVSGRDDAGLGEVTVNDQDGDNQPITEFCEHPNPFSENGDCSCPAQFDAYSSSSMTEFGTEAQPVSLDRPTYCIGKELGEAVSVSDEKPLDNCQNPWERAYVVGDERVCSPIVHDICKAFGGEVDTSSEKCVYSRASFFWGKFSNWFQWSSNDRWCALVYAT